MRKTIEYIINILTTGAIIVGVYNACLFGLYTLLPTSYWFEYQDIKPAKTVFHDEDIVFVTNFKMKRPFQFTANHILRCNLEDEYLFYSSQVNEVEVTKAHIGVGTGKFIYSEPKPMPPRTCYVESTMTAKIKYGIQKQQVIIGEPFEVN